MADSSRFFESVESGDLEMVRALLAEHPELVHAPDADGASALSTRRSMGIGRSSRFSSPPACS